MQEEAEGYAKQLSKYISKPQTHFEVVTCRVAGKSRTVPEPGRRRAQPPDPAGPGAALAAARRWGSGSAAPRRAAEQGESSVSAADTTHDGGRIKSATERMKTHATYQFPLKAKANGNIYLFLSSHYLILYC